MDRKQLIERLDKIEQRLSRLESSVTRKEKVNPSTDAVTWSQVAMAYRERYLTAKKGEVLDYFISKDRTVFEDIAQVVQGYAAPMSALEAALDGFFEDKWVVAHSYPPSALLKGFERFRCPPVIDGKDEPDPEAINAKRLRERRKEEQAALMQQLARDQEEAAPPPEGLEEMVARIGKGLK